MNHNKYITKRKKGSLKIDKEKMLADFLEDQILNKKGIAICSTRTS